MCWGLAELVGKRSLGLTGPCTNCISVEAIWQCMSMQTPFLQLGGQLCVDTKLSPPANL